MSIAVYYKNVSDYENTISLIYGRNGIIASLEERRESLSTIKSTYDRLVNEFLLIYSNQSLDIDDYYQVDCIPRPPNKPPQYTGITKEGNLFY